jgi:hypothetical protein
MHMTGYYPHTLHTGGACDLRRRGGVKGVTVLKVNRTCARVPQESSERKHIDANVKGEGL